MSRCGIFFLKLKLEMLLANQIVGFFDQQNPEKE